MKPFALAAVLRYRKRREAEQQQRHSAALRRRQQALAELGTLVAHYERVLNILAQHQESAHLDAAAVERIMRYQDTLAQAIADQRARVEQAEQELDREHTALVRAAQERQALERLKQRHDAAQRYEEARRDANEQDNITTARYVLRHAAPPAEG